MSGACFHCGTAIPAGVALTVSVRGKAEPVCCAGCRAVAALIDEHGLAKFYDFRTAPSRKPLLESGPWAVCDRPEIARRIARELGGGMQELTCRVDGVTCAACTWLLDRGLRAVDGVSDVAVNPLSGEAVIRFDAARTRVSNVLAGIERLGFMPRVRLGGAPGTDSTAARAQLKRLAVAGLGAMQVMTLSVALYAGAFTQMEAVFKSYFALVSMLIATPVVLYSGGPIFRSAWQSLACRRLGMDVPVALALAAALGASLFNALRGAGEVYFDSATMFVFLLTLGRFLEARARHRAGSVLDALGDLSPLVATRRRGAALERVGTIELAVGDRVLVAPGEAVPADGRLLSADGSFDESLLSGESLGRVRRIGDDVLGGSLNASCAPVEVEVTRLGADSYVQRVGSLLNRALADRPESLAIADRWAAWFVAGLLVVTAIAGCVWLSIAPERAFGVVLALLVVTCPCALSLATPTAFAVALGRLAQRGLLLTSARVLERLRDVRVWMFDKTGTLTEGRLGLARVTTYSVESEAAALAIAAALEAGLEHPIARALRAANGAAADAADVQVRTGYGVAGTVAGRRYTLGSARYIGAAAAPHTAPNSVYLAEGARLVARIELADSVRPHARAALAALESGGARVTLVSGDERAAVLAVAERLQIRSALAAQSPADKLAVVAAEQAGGHVVAAVGDGINDAPLLAAADVSVAMQAGSRLAQATADVVFTGDDLRVLARLPAYAAATRSIVRENLTWAAAYNLIAVPLAAAGVLSPWMAAVGMSASSLVVVGNALRLARVLAALDGAARTPPVVAAVPVPRSA
jgi:Cu2+-exporting ATPase